VCFPSYNLVTSPVFARSQECSYCEGGLGCRVWGAAYMLSSQLAQRPDIVDGKTVLGAALLPTHLFECFSNTAVSHPLLVRRVPQNSVPAAVSLG
jgi:predicted nicotinamide N-methyase